MQTLTNEPMLAPSIPAPRVSKICSARSRVIRRCPFISGQIAPGLAEFSYPLNLQRLKKEGFGAPSAQCPTMKTRRRAFSLSLHSHLRSRSYAMRGVGTGGDNNPDVRV